ncbi:TPA: trypsin-like peptidase domain-containing protein [Bacillus cereus]|uniref:S1 family peptidase n=1 Tax=Bacillus sp. FSL H8-0545 TaxID=2921402 RepID=UPI0030F69B2A|nr:trypsin-like peptidase domain-containing protein [Bacillus cereus]
MTINTVEDLQFATVIISTKDDKGEPNCGTGFIMDLGEKTIKGVPVKIPVIVTNKHVIEGAVEGTIQFHAVTKEGKREGQCKFHVENFEKKFYDHPEKDVDLCAMAIAPLHGLTAKDGIRPYYKSVSLSQVMDEKGLQGISATKDIVVVGYPNAIWDEVNNFPIFRKGILATAPSVNYKGEEEFLIDCAIYPGSSGSPVFSIETLFDSKTFDPFLSIKLLGVVFASYEHTAEGDVVIEKIPTSAYSTLIPNHLGVVIKSTRLFELGKILEDIYIHKEAPILDYRGESFGSIITMEE